MVEYIEREAILSEIERREALMVGDKRISVDAMKHFIKNRPSSDVAPVRHGRWIEHKHFHHDHYIDSTYECSECKAEEPLTSDYCPNCGAKMDLED